MASTKPNAWILDPFAGSSSTGIAANLANRRFLGIDQEMEFLEISKNRKLEIENIALAKEYKKKIAGFIHPKQYASFLEKEPTSYDLKVVLGFCKSKDLKNLENQKTFYFHAIESDNRVKDFPLGILDASKLIIYSGGRSKPLKLTGHYSDIQSIELKHKSTIKGKEESKTEFYYEIELTENFKKSEELTCNLNLKSLFEPTDTKNPQLLKQFLPALTTWNKLRSVKKILSTTI